MFRRRSKVEDVDEDAIDDVPGGDDSADAPDDSADSPDGGEADGGATDPGFVVPASAGPPKRPTGPFDVEDLPKDDQTPRLDLGSLQVPVPEGIEVRVDVQDDVIVAATLVDGRNELQVHAFAAPRSSGLWAEVRGEIAESLQGSGGSAEDVDGPFGPELRARVPVEGGALQPARFIGVDGPRWFLRGLFTGPASTDPTQASRLEQAFRGVAVDRGG
ncbi:MAG TPA: DUF3710 domain-containing protein, partial [Mycobacteriales bacterium]|nr:DUF3710 domain-containing protein [Mycobacteriales bacterium]